MKPLYLFVLSIVFCTCVPGAQAASPPGDKELSKRVTLAVKGEALSDIMAMLSKQTGLKLRATKDIGDQKATIFVDRKPVKDVLDSLETIFGYRWSVVKSDKGKAYELWETEKARAEREAAAGKTKEAALRALEQRIREVATSTPEEQERYRKEYQQFQAAILAKGSITQEEGERRAALLYRFGPAVGAARLYTRLSPTAIQALQSGASVYLDTDTNEAQWRVPPDVDAEIMAREAENVFKTWTGRPPAGYNIRCVISGANSPVPDKLSFICMGTGFRLTEDGDQGRSGGFNGIVSAEAPTGDLRPEQPIKLPHADDNGTLAKQFSFTDKELADEADLYGRTEKNPPIFVNRSDILSLLHWKLGVQSISDHHSLCFAWDPQGLQTVKDLLEHLAEMIARPPKSPYMNPYSDPMWGWDGTCVLMRERLPYKQDRRETPSRLIRRLRTNLAQNHYLDFDDFAEVAALTVDQISRLIENWDWLIRVRGGDYSGSPARSEMTTGALDPAIRLYAHLTDTQKRAVRANGLPVTDIMPCLFDDLVMCLPAPSLVGQPIQAILDDLYRRRVGIYKRHIRLDKPEPGSTMPAVIRLVRRESRKYNCAQAGGFDTSLEAQSPEDAWQQYLERSPDLAKHPCFFGKDMGYAMLFIFPDGTTKERPIELYAPVSTRG